MALSSCLLTAAVAAGVVKLAVVNGSSMLPAYKKGDLVVVAKLPPYETGAVVAYRDPSTGQDVLHRIVDVTDEGFLVRGDNNESVDPYSPTVDGLFGREVVRVSAAGALVSNRAFLPAVAVVAVLVVVVKWTTGRRKRVRSARRPLSHLPTECVDQEQRSVDASRREAVVVKKFSVEELATLDIDNLDLDTFDWASFGLVEEREVFTEADVEKHAVAHLSSPMERLDRCDGTEDRPLPPAGPQGVLPTHVVAVAKPRERKFLVLVPAVLSLLFTVMCVGASVLSLVAPPEGEVPTGERGLLRYQAEVESGATYPSGKVETGDMVFVQLVKQLDLVYEHQLTPGASRPAPLAFRAELSTPGWSRELPLRQAVEEEISGAQGKAVRISTKLDTAVAFETLTAMGDETGVHYGAATVTITVSPTVFSEPATLTFRATEESLAPEQMTPTVFADGSKAIVVDVMAEAASGSLVPRSWLRFLLLAAVAGVVVSALLWPSRGAERALPKNADLRRLPSLHIFVDDRATFDALAAASDTEMLEADGWVAVVFEDRLYWTDVSPDL